MAPPARTTSEKAPATRGSQSERAAEAKTRAGTKRAAAAAAAATAAVTRKQDRVPRKRGRPAQENTEGGGKQADGPGRGKRTRFSAGDEGKGAPGLDTSAEPQPQRTQTQTQTHADSQQQPQPPHVVGNHVLLLVRDVQPGDYPGLMKRLARSVMGAVPYEGPPGQQHQQGQSSLPPSSSSAAVVGGLGESTVQLFVDDSTRAFLDAWDESCQQRIAMATSSSEQ